MWHLDPHVKWDKLEDQLDMEWTENEEELEKSQQSFNDFMAPVIMAGS